MYRITLYIVFIYCLAGWIWELLNGFMKVKILKLVAVICTLGTIMPITTPFGKSPSKSFLIINTSNSVVWHTLQGSSMRQPIVPEEEINLGTINWCRTTWLWQELFYPFYNQLCSMDGAASDLNLFRKRESLELK